MGTTLTDPGGLSTRGTRGVRRSAFGVRRSAFGVRRKFFVLVKISKIQLKN
jgi:hypothetical protein